MKETNKDIEKKNTDTMEDGAVRRAVKHTQDHNKNQIAKFKDDFKDLFQSVSQSTVDSESFNNQKQLLKSILQDAALIEYRSSKYNETLDNIQNGMYDNNDNNGGSSSSSTTTTTTTSTATTTSTNVSRFLHEALETLPTECPDNVYPQQNVYRGFSRMFVDNSSSGSSSSNNRRNMMMPGGDSDEELEIIEDAVAMSDKCPIAGVKIKIPMTSTKCNHTFSQAGLKQWFTRHRARKCPMAGCKMDGRTGSTCLKMSDFVIDREFFNRVAESQRAFEASQARNGGSSSIRGATQMDLTQ